MLVEDQMILEEVFIIAPLFSEIFSITPETFQKNPSATHLKMTYTLSELQYTRFCEE